MRRDMQTSTFSSVLLLKQLFEQAERQSVDLQIDLARTDDMGLQDAVAKWDRDVRGSGSAPSLRARAAVDSRAVGGASLPSILQAQDARLVADLQNTRDDKASLQEQFERLKLQCSDALREKSELARQLEAVGGSEAARLDEIDALRAQVEQLQAELDASHDANAHRSAGGGADLENVMAELHQVQQVNAQLGADLDQARADLNARIERSAPFMNLQRMLQNKNRQVRGLRETLQAHGIHVDDIEATDD
jgi:chromosome segregation ATPase